jgi:hypothetical protein
MSKKHRRQVSRVTAPVAALPNRSYEFNPDYTTTKHELRRIGVLAAVFFGILIVLSFFQDRLLAAFLK